MNSPGGGSEETELEILKAPHVNLIARPTRLSRIRARVLCQPRSLPLLPKWPLFQEDGSELPPHPTELSVSADAEQSRHFVWCDEGAHTSCLIPGTWGESSLPGLAVTSWGQGSASVASYSLILLMHSMGLSGDNAFINWVCKAMACSSDRHSPRGLSGARHYFSSQALQNSLLQHQSPALPSLLRSFGPPA